MLVARVVLQDEFIIEHVTAGRWQHRRLWLGLKARGKSGSVRGRRSSGNQSPEGVADSKPATGRPKDVEMSKV